MATLEEIIQESWQIAEDHGFHSAQRSYGDVCALIHTEVSESFERYRNDRRHVEWVEADGKPEGSLSELADVVIRCFDAVVEAGMSADNFASLIECKMEYNKHRPHMHGRAL